MAVKLTDLAVRASLGKQAGRRAYIALSFRALGVSMWATFGVFAVVTLLYSLTLGLGEDEQDFLFSTRWWVWISVLPVFAVLGTIGFWQFHVWERKALADKYGEIRLEPRPDPN